MTAAVVREDDPYPAPPDYEPCCLCFRSIEHGRGAGWDNPSNSDLPLPPPCTHWFCSDCLVVYASRGGRTCPLCRANWGAFLYARYVRDNEEERDSISSFSSSTEDVCMDDVQDEDPISSFSSIGY